jgi:hypothetical protein
MSDPEPSRPRSRWAWILLGVVVVYSLSKLVAAVVDGSWWQAISVLLFAGFVLSGWTLLADMHAGRFPSNRARLRHLLISGAFLLAIMLEFIAAWIVGRDVRWASMGLWIAISLTYVVMLPRAIREYRKDPIGSSFRQKYEQRLAKQTWP